jgi:hypothetical protein
MVPMRLPAGGVLAVMDLDTGYGRSALWKEAAEAILIVRCNNVLGKPQPNFAGTFK